MWSEYVLENGSTDFYITSSIWLWHSAGYDTKNIHHRWAYTTFHYKISQWIWCWFYVYDYRRHGGLALPEVRGTASPHGGVYPPPIRFLPRAPSRHSSLLHRQAKTDRLDWLARTPLAHHFDFVWGQGSAQLCRSYLELDDNRKNMILFGDATESYDTAWTSSLERTCYRYWKMKIGKI